MGLNIKKNKLVYIVATLLLVAVAIFLIYPYRTALVDSDYVKSGNYKIYLYLYKDSGGCSYTFARWWGVYKATCKVESDKTSYTETHDRIPNEYGYIPSWDFSCEKWASVTCDIYAIEPEYKYLGEVSVAYGSHGGPDCEDECAYNEEKHYCVGDELYVKECGNYDDDGCLEWSEGRFVEDCDDMDGYYCEGNKRVYRDYYCSESVVPAQCKYSESYVENCNDYDGWYCKDDHTREYRDYKCLIGECTYTVTDTESCPSGYKCSNGKCVAQKPSILDWIIDIIVG